MNTQELPVIGGVSDLEGGLDSETDKSFIEKSTDWYFAPKSFERSGKLYEALGVRPFKKLVMGTFGKLHKILGADKTGSNYFIGQDRSKRGLKKFEAETRFNEFVHAPFTAYCGYKLAEDLGNNNYSGAIVDGIGLLINGYCTMLQRYNRARVYNTLDKLAERTPAVQNNSSNL